METCVTGAATDVPARTWCGGFACVRTVVCVLCFIHIMTPPKPARCVSHKEKFLVVSHKGTVFFPCGIFRKSKISH